jgi:hypothetical protein
MKTMNCYSGYTWRVFQNNRFVGYVVSMSSIDAMRKANEKFGKYIWIERVVSLS